MTRLSLLGHLRRVSIGLKSEIAALAAVLGVLVAGTPRGAQAVEGERGGVLEGKEVPARACPALSLRGSALWPTAWEREVSLWVQEPSSCALVNAPIGRAHDALERAQTQLEEGQSAELELLEGLAQQWYSVARDLLRAEDVERQASEVEGQWVELETQLARVHASLEQVRAHISRLALELEVAPADGE